ncbi:TPA: transporter substrate-binding domain-containing protein [Vibrio cholerae]|nr:transporter substrate-binding domain-containing protein [Vibrio cholerae]
MIRILTVLSLYFVSCISYGKETFNIVYYDSFPPYSYKNSSGQMEGILVDIATEVLEKNMGLTVSHQGYPWERAQRMVFNGQADAFISVLTPERLEYVNAAAVPVVIGPITLFTYRNHPNKQQLEKISGIEDLKAYTILDYVGNGWGQSHFPQDSYTRILKSDLSSALIMLAKKRGDVVATDRIVADYLLSKYDIRSLVEEIPITLATVSFSLCISKLSPFTHISEEFSEQMLTFRSQGRDKNILEQYK